MSRRSVPLKKTIALPVPPFSHDPNVIKFRLWTALLYLEGQIPEEIRWNETVLFLDEDAEACGTKQISVRTSVRVMNPTRYSLLNVSVVRVRSGDRVFYAQELPAGKFLHLEFLQEGAFTLHYFPAFRPATLRRELRVVPLAPPASKIAPNFHPSLKPKGWV